MKPLSGDMHHVYKCVWTPVMDEKLECNKVTRAEAKEHDENAIGVYRITKQLDVANQKKIFVGHVPIELSRLIKNFLEANTENKLVAQVTWKEEKRNWPCCSGKVLDLHNGPAPCQNPGDRVTQKSFKVHSL